MTRENQIVINEDRGTFYCFPCDRSFRSANGARSHCENANAHAGQFCDRCEWLFVSSDALQSHQAASTRHHICYDCNYDFLSQAELKVHNENVHFICQECDDSFDDDWELDQHRERCHGSDRSDTDESDDNDSEDSVPNTNQYECVGCQSQFEYTSSVILHLESGACTSETKSVDVERWAYQYYQSRFYTNNYRNYYRFRCPECRENFRFLSGLISHIEDGSCRQGWDNVINGVLDHIDDKVRRRV